MNHFVPACVAAWACVMPLMAQASTRDITDYPVCLEIRSEVLMLTPRYYTPGDVTALVERCMDWQDEARAGGYGRMSGV